MTYCNGEISVIRPDLTSPGAYLISSLCTMSWSSVTSGKWPSWSVSKCSRSWRHRSQKPRVRPCEPLCGLLRGGAASLPWRGIQSLFRADFCGLPRLCGGRRKRQDKNFKTGARAPVFLLEGSPLRHGTNPDGGAGAFRRYNTLLPIPSCNPA